MKHAILMDGGFLKPKYKKAFRRRIEARDVSSLAAHLSEKHGNGHTLLRIYYYDSPPLDSEIRQPITNIPLNLKSSEVYRHQSKLLSELKKSDFVLVEDDERNNLITDDIVRAVERGRVPLVLSERRRHLQLLKERIEERGLACALLVGGMGKKRSATALELLQSQDKSVLLATGKLIGEGFDHPQLDTLFLTFPISWKGIVQQYVGRIHRRHADKDEVQVYDYVDTQVPVLAASFKRRAKSYRRMGYKVREEESDIHE